MNIQTLLMTLWLGLLLQGCATKDVTAMGANPPPMILIPINCEEAPVGNVCGRPPQNHVIKFDIANDGVPSGLKNDPDVSGVPDDQMPNGCTQDSITWKATGTGKDRKFNIIFVDDNFPSPGQLSTASVAGSQGQEFTVGPLKQTGNPNDRECLAYSVYVKPVGGDLGGFIDPVVILER